MDEKSSLSNKLLNGEKVVCEECNKGVYKTACNVAAESHYFECDVCGAFVHMDPYIEIR